MTDGGLAAPVPGFCLQNETRQQGVLRQLHPWGLVFCKGSVGALCALMEQSAFTLALTANEAASAWGGAAKHASSPGHGGRGPTPAALQGHEGRSAAAGGLSSPAFRRVPLPGRAGHVARPA